MSKTNCSHHWHIPTPTPGAEFLDQTCYLCGASKPVPAYGQWDKNQKWQKR